MKIKFFIILYFFLFKFFSQNVLNDIKNKTDSICKKVKVESFCQAINFYKLKEYDSCYVYANKALLNINKTNEKDIIYYIQGVSAINKRLFKKGFYSVSQISEEGKFVNLKKLKLGLISLSLKDYNKAIKYYLSWEINENESKISHKKNAFHNLGLSYIHVKKYEKAKEYFKKEFSLIESNDTLALIRAKMDLANVYYNQYLDDEAIPLFKESYDLAKIFSNLKLKQNSAKNMAVVERNRKNYKESVAYYREFIKWKDSIWNRDNILELTERDKKLAVAQKQQEIAIQDETNINKLKYSFN